MRSSAHGGDNTAGDDTAIGKLEIGNIINQFGYTAVVALGTLLAARTGILKKILN